MRGMRDGLPYEAFRHSANPISQPDPPMTCLFGVSSPENICLDHVPARVGPESANEKTARRTTRRGGGGQEPDIPSCSPQGNLESVKP